MKKNTNISGVTLVEILIGVVISVVMMAAMFTSYNVVNNTYSKVTDTAKMSQAGRETLGMIMKDVRMAGYRYFGDNIPYDPVQHIPIKITKQSNTNPCDKLEIVYGDLEADDQTPPNFTFKRYRVTYFCAEDDRNDPDNINSNYYQTQNLKFIKKKKEVWIPGNPGKFSVTTSSKTYDEETIVQYVQDLIFDPVDNEGKLIDPPPSDTDNQDKVNAIKIVEVLLSVRSKNTFYRAKKVREKKALNDEGRNPGKGLEDRYLRETILISAHARNLGL